MMIQATVIRVVIDGSGGELKSLTPPSVQFPIINRNGTLSVFVVSASDMRVRIRIFVSDAEIISFSFISACQDLQI